VSVHRKKDRWVVRWREEGRQRSRSFRTKHEAVVFDRERQRDERRDFIAMPEGAVAAEVVDEGVSFLVMESLEPISPTAAVPKRPIHSGFFKTIRQAEAYRRQMPDADALDITLQYDRYLLRDLTEAEIAAGEIDVRENSAIVRSVIEQIRREQEAS
jgi:hypothetical protein